jgi:hypothetical protein
LGFGVFAADWMLGRFDETVSGTAVSPLWLPLEIDPSAVLDAAEPMARAAGL